MSHPSSCLFAAALLGLAAAGCVSLSREAPHKQRYLPQLQHDDAPPRRDGPVLVVATPHVAPAFATKEMVYRTAPSTFVSDYYHEYFVAPGELIGGLLREHLRGSGLFRLVAGPGLPVPPDLVLETDVLELYGDFADPADRAAQLALRVLVLRRDDARGELVPVQQETYRSRLPVAEPTPPALIAAFERGLAEVFGRIEKDLRELVNGQGSGER